MSRKAPRKTTSSEKAHLRAVENASGLDLVERGRARCLLPAEYPEPLKRFLARERLMVHVRLSPRVKRRLEARSQQTGVPIDELARRWIEQAMRRDAG
jgi:hypothetical protein